MDTELPTSAEKVPVPGLASAELVRDKTVARLRATLDKWERQAVALRSLHAALTLNATVCSFLVAAKVDDTDSALHPHLEWVSFGAAVSIGLLSAFDLGSKANRLRRAWRKLRAQLFLYDQGRASVDELVRVYIESEELIGDVKEEPK